MNRRRVLAVVGGAFVFGYLFAALFFFPGWGRRAIVTVPDMRGRPLAQARRLADRAGLEIERGTTLAHPTVRRGAVLAQDPLPGQETTRGDAVRVTLSAGPDRRPVPPVAGLLGEQAHKLLLRTGFQVRLDSVVDERPAGRIVAVEPESGTVLPLPASVLLRISRGPPPPPPPAPGEVAVPEPAVEEPKPAVDTVVTEDSVP